MSGPAGGGSQGPRSKRVTPRSIAAAILDMDGLLIDTEPMWRRVEAVVFGELGVTLSEAELATTMGVRVVDSVAHWRRLRPWPGSASGQPSDTEIAERIIDGVVVQVVAGGEPQPGVTEAVTLIRRLGLRLAIASSSPHRLIDAVCARLGLEIDIRCSATDEERGKPSPDVYFAAAGRLGVEPERCLAIEDSPSGVLAAVAAGMRCIAVPDPVVGGDPAYAAADLRLESLLELDEAGLRVVGWDR